nr:hypothetical protein Q903MT_gene4660 [Picea sitchensis]
MIDTVLESLLYRTERISALLYRNSIVLVECGWMPLPNFSKNLEMGRTSPAQPSPSSSIMGKMLDPDP